jgi:hypothetical protein
MRSNVGASLLAMLLESHRQFKRKPPPPMTNALQKTARKFILLQHFTPDV